MAWIISIIGLLILSTICFIGYWLEKRDFNNGICPFCETPLRHFDDDSQGGQGWTCDRCGYTTWISWFKKYD